MLGHPIARKWSKPFVASPKLALENIYHYRLAPVDTKTGSANNTNSSIM